MPFCPLNLAKVFHSSIPSPFGIIETITCFSRFELFWNISKIYFFLFSMQNIKNNCHIIFLEFFSIIFFLWKSYYFLIIKALIFLILCGFFSISLWFNATVTAYWKYLSFFWLGLLLLFYFLLNQENLYMIHHDLDLFWWHLQYNKWTWSKTNSLPFIDSELFWYIFLSESKSSFITQLLYH